MELQKNCFTDAAGPESVACNVASRSFEEVLGAELSTEAPDRLLVYGMAAALAPNTLKAYGTGWRNWCLWATGRGVSVFPADCGDL